MRTRGLIKASDFRAVGATCSLSLSCSVSIEDTQVGVAAHHSHGEQPDEPFRCGSSAVVVQLQSTPQLRYMYVRACRTEYRMSVSMHAPGYQ